MSMFAYLLEEKEVITMDDIKDLALVQELVEDVRCLGLGIADIEESFKLNFLDIEKMKNDIKYYKKIGTLKNYKENKEIDSLEDKEIFNVFWNNLEMSEDDKIDYLEYWGYVFVCDLMYHYIKKEENSENAEVREMLRQEKEAIKQDLIGYVLNDLQEEANLAKEVKEEIKRYGIC